MLVLSAKVTFAVDATIANLYNIYSDTDVTYANCTHGDIRLAGSSIVTKGRVELCFNGVWGTICGDGWDIIDANVVCDQLGYYPSGIEMKIKCNADLITTGAKARYGAFFGEGFGPIYLSNLQCTGSEHSVVDCSRNVYSVSNCAHYEDAGVECDGMSELNYIFTLCEIK